jgi:hypothetical protein
MNTGSGPLSISLVAITGAPFFLSAPPITPLVLNPGSSKELAVGFSPTHEGDVMGTLSPTTRSPPAPRSRCRAVA